MLLAAGGWDNEASDLIMSVGDLLEGPNGTRHLVLDSLGQGTFGQVGGRGVRGWQRLFCPGACDMQRALRFETERCTAASDVGCSGCDQA